MEQKYFIDHFDIYFDKEKHMSKVKDILKKYNIRLRGMEGTSGELTATQLKGLIKFFNKIGEKGSFDAKDVNHWTRRKMTLNARKEDGFTTKEYSKGGIINLLNTRVKLF